MNNNEVAQTCNEEEKQPLQDIDISNLIFIKNPNNELALGNHKVKFILIRILQR
jgi:hypothetical protein